MNRGRKKCEVFRPLFLRLSVLEKSVMLCEVRFSKRTAFLFEMGVIP